jgi:hypothetical protein
LKELLYADAAAVKANSKQTLQQAFDQINNPTRYQLAVCSGEILAQTDQRAITLTEADELCKTAADSSLRKKFDCYLSGIDKCTDPPKEGEDGILREFYRQVQKLSHCKNLSPANPLPELQTILNLVKYHDVEKSFFITYASELKEVESRLAAAGVPESLRIPIDPKRLTRADLIRRAHGLRDHFPQLQQEAKSIESRLKGGPVSSPQEQRDQARLDQLNAALTVEAFVRGIESTLIELMPDCVPMGWLSGVPERNKCVDLPDQY